MGFFVPDDTFREWTRRGSNRKAAGSTVVLRSSTIRRRRAVEKVRRLPSSPTAAWLQAAIMSAHDEKPRLKDRAGQATSASRTRPSRRRVRSQKLQHLPPPNRHGGAGLGPFLGKPALVLAGISRPGCGKFAHNQYESCASAARQKL